MVCPFLLKTTQTKYYVCVGDENNNIACKTHIGISSSTCIYCLMVMMMMMIMMMGFRSKS